MAALFITAQVWKPSRCPPVGRETDKLWCIQIRECYLVMQINELSNQKHMNEAEVYITKGKKSVRKGYIRYLSNHMTSEEGKTRETVKIAVVASGYGEGEG